MKDRVGLVMFVVSAPVTMAAYIINEPFNLTVAAMLIFTCAFLSYMPGATYTPYERREAQPPINPDNESEPDWIAEIKSLNYEITPPKHYTYAQKLAFDPCPQS